MIAALGLAGTFGAGRLDPRLGSTTASAEDGSDRLVAFGDARDLGSPEGFAALGRFVAVESTPSGRGYWMADAAGGVYAYGDAAFLGSVADRPLTRPITDLVATATGDGYWLLAEDGGIFAFGDADFHGAMVGTRLNRPMVALAPTPLGNGYWMVGDDGGVFAFGDAEFRGATGAQLGAAPIVGISSSLSGRGYWIVAADGAVYAYGDAEYVGGLGGPGMHQPIVDFAVTDTGRGYWLVTREGGVFGFGDAREVGSIVGSGDTRAVAIAGTPSDRGYLVAVVPPGFEPAPSIPIDSGAGRRIVYSNSQQRVWLVEDDGRLYDSWLVSGKQGVPLPGSYTVFSKSELSWSGSLKLPYMTRFAHGRTKAIGFHGIPSRGDGSLVQTVEELGQFRSAGCVRQELEQAKRLYEWTPVGTPVIVLA